MSTHNIGFYEDLTKIIFELSSNIIKYAPYFFCCTVKFVCIEVATYYSMCNVDTVFGLCYPLMCGILSEALVMPGKLHIAVSCAKRILKTRFPHGVSCKYWP